MSHSSSTSPSMSQSNSSATVAHAPQGELPTKLCHILKRPDFEGYGFNLHSEKSKPGQYIGKVDPHSPAEVAGLKEGDRIIEVNGVAIGNETHKQVVQRIKAISCEVRLLLVDADGIGTSDGDSKKEHHGTVQEMPGASANISSISLTSTKRASNASSHSTSSMPSADVTDKSIPSSQNGTQVDSTQASTATQYQQNIINNNNGNIKTPPPPSAAVASIASVSQTNNNSSSNKGLQLPTTAAEMRAKLLSRKKYDPKNEGVDLKKKFEIIQKL